jgi:polyisoprenoid-binding protein YceI
MPLRPGSHTIGPDSGTMQVHTYREGVAQKVGHDLVLDIGGWQARVQIGDDQVPESIELEVDPRSLTVGEGLGGVKPLSEGDRSDIVKNIDGKVLRGQPIKFYSTTVQSRDGGFGVQGELTLAGQTRPVSHELELSADGAISATLPVTQSEWGIKPYRALMGALRVKDEVEIVLDARLPAE